MYIVTCTVYIYKHEAIRISKSENNIGAPLAPQKYSLNTISNTIYYAFIRLHALGSLVQYYICTKISSLLVQKNLLCEAIRADMENIE